MSANVTKIAELRALSRELLRIFLRGLSIIAVRADLTY